MFVRGTGAAAHESREKPKTLRGGSSANHGGYASIELIADVAEQAERPVTQPNENDLFPPKKKRLRSAVWEHFGYKKDAQGLVKDDGFPICKACRQAISCKGSNTSNVQQHLRDHHPDLHAKLVKVSKQQAK